MANGKGAKMQRARKVYRTAIDRISSSFTNFVSNPIHLVLIAGVIAIALSHTTGEKTNSELKQWIGKLKNENSSASWVKTVDWLVANEEKFVKMVVFLPAVLRAGKNSMLLFGVASVAWVLYGPAFTLNNAILQSFLLFLFLTPALASERLGVLILAVILYYTGFLHT